MLSTTRRVCPHWRSSGGGVRRSLCDGWSRANARDGSGADVLVVPHRWVSARRRGRRGRADDVPVVDGRLLPGYDLDDPDERVDEQVDGGRLEGYDELEELVGSVDELARDVHVDEYPGDVDDSLLVAVQRLGVGQSCFHAIWSKINKE